MQQTRADTSNRGRNYKLIQIYLKIIINLKYNHALFYRVSFGDEIFTIFLMDNPTCLTNNILEVIPKESQAFGVFFN